jgi:hypothetical protein
MAKVGVMGLMAGKLAAPPKLFQEHIAVKLLLNSRI